MEAFPFRATIVDQTIVIQAERDEFEKCIRWGYLRHAEQRDADMRKLDPRSTDEKTPQGKDAAASSIADYFETCGNLRSMSQEFHRFLEERVRPNHYYKVKLSAYLDLALVRVWGECSETT